jgi:hypothetical protein
MSRRRGDLVDDAARERVHVRDQLALLDGIYRGGIDAPGRGAVRVVALVGHDVAEVRNGACRKVVRKLLERHHVGERGRRLQLREVHDAVMPVWLNGNNAIVITFDEGSAATSKIATIVITNHGPRGLKDGTSYNHYSLLASLQQTFGLGCLRNSCTANAMEKLFAITGATSIPPLPAPYDFPTTTDTISAQSRGTKAAPVSLTGTGWQVVPSISYGSNDNVLAGVAAASATDVWAVGTYYPTANGPLATLAHHFDGTAWTAYKLPNVGVQQNVLLGVSMPATGKAWRSAITRAANLRKTP